MMSTKSSRGTLLRKVAKLKHMLEAKASELAGTGMVMVHDLLVLTNDFLSDKNRADEERSRGRSGDESLFQKMLTEKQRQREKRVSGGATATIHGQSVP